MKTFEIHEQGNGRFATIQARTPVSALNKAAKLYRRRSCDYNGYTGPVEWSAFSAEYQHALATKTVYVR